MPDDTGTLASIVISIAFYFILHETLMSDNLAFVQNLTNFFPFLFTVCVFFVQAISAALSRPSYRLINSRTSALTTAGSALPFIARIVCPTMKPIAFSFPALKSATD